MIPVLVFFNANDGENDKTNPQGMLIFQAKDVFHKNDIVDKMSAIVEAYKTENPNDWNYQEAVQEVAEFLEKEGMNIDFDFERVLLE